MVKPPRQAQDLPGRFLEASYSVHGALVWQVWIFKLQTSIRNPGIPIQPNVPIDEVSFVPRILVSIVVTKIYILKPASCRGVIVLGRSLVEFMQVISSLAHLIKTPRPLGFTFTHATKPLLAWIRHIQIQARNSERCFLPTKKKETKKTYPN